MPSPLFNFHACQRLRMFIFISFMLLPCRVCFEIRRDLEWGKKKQEEDCGWGAVAGGKGGVWFLQTHVTRDAGPQCSSVNSMFVPTYVSACVCVAQYCAVQPLGSRGWWPLYVAPLSHPFTSHCFGCHTHRSRARRETHARHPVCHIP